MPETAYLYDAVHLYERSLLKALDENRDPRNGREMVATLYGVHYRSAMGYVQEKEKRRGGSGIGCLSRRFTICKSVSWRDDLAVRKVRRKWSTRTWAMYLRRSDYRLHIVIGWTKMKTRQFVVLCMFRRKRSRLTIKEIIMQILRLLRTKLEIRTTFILFLDDVK